VKLSTALMAFFCFCLNISLASASIKVTGEIVATKECEAYASIRKQSNPGDVTLRLAVSYSVVEANKASATWYRIKVEGAKPVRRWVNADCGVLTLREPLNTQAVKTDCNTVGQADGFKLALSWHPAFCETKPNKPECKVDDARLYQARNFTLHGLWPNKQACGIAYGFCGKVRRTMRSFCNYPKLTLSNQIRAQLNEVMPSALEGSCLQRHEWFKHGSCEDDWDVNGYYEVSVRLTREFNESGIAKWMQANVGRTVATRDFQLQVDASLGVDAHKRLQLKCKKGNLVDVYINLPKDLSDQPLSQLLLAAREDLANACGARFKIDRIGVGR